MFITTKEGLRINYSNVKFYEPNNKGGTRTWWLSNGKLDVTESPSEFDALVREQIKLNRPPYGP